MIFLPHGVISIGAILVQLLIYFSKYNILEDMLGLQDEFFWALAILVLLSAGILTALRGLRSGMYRGLAIISLILNILMLYVFFMFVFRYSGELIE